MYQSTVPYLVAGVEFSPSENIVEMRASALTLILGFISRYFRYTLQKNDTQSFFLAYPLPSSKVMVRLKSHPTNKKKKPKPNLWFNLGLFGCGSGI